MENDQNKQQVVKEAWLGNLPDGEQIHPAAAAAAARMRARLFDSVADTWIHRVELKEGGKRYRLWAIGKAQSKKEFIAPAADTRLNAIAKRAHTDGWDPKGNEVDFRIWEPVTLQNRVMAGGPFIYGTRAEAVEALAELLFEGSAILLSKERENGRLDEAVHAWIDYMHNRVEQRSSRYETVEDDML
ncbi:MAG: hypothetical protein R2826_03690 [Thermoleophilia bacterium]